MTDKQKWISDKIAKILHEDKNIKPSQAAAIAFNYYEREHKQQGGSINSYYKPIDLIQQGVSSGKMGEGYYVYNSDGTREFINKEGLNTLKSSEAFENFINKGGNIGVRVPGTEDKSYRPYGSEGENLSKLKPLFKVQQGVSNPKMGEGYYLYYKDPTKEGFNVETDREFVTQEAFRNVVQPSFEYKKMMSMQNKPSMISKNPLTSLQQGGYYDNNNPYFTTAVQNQYSQPLENFLPKDQSFSTQIDNYQPYTMTEEERLKNLQGNMLTPYGENLISQTQQELEKPEQQTTKTYNDQYKLINPYGDVSLEYALSFAGKGFGEGNVGKGLLGTGKALLGGARSFLSGMSTAKTEEEARQKYYSDVRDNSNYRYAQQGGKYSDLYNFMQQGGEVPTNAEIFTGEYAQPLPPELSQMANVNVENDEYIKHGDTGQVQEVEGKTHKQGGEDMILSNGSKVISDFTEIGADNAKYFSKTYDIKLKSKDTFATVIEKYTKKIGLEEIFEEEEEIYKEIEKQNQGKKDKTTVGLNFQLLSKKLQEIKENKLTLEKLREVVYDDVFNKQEAIPKKGNGELLEKQEGGEIQEQSVDIQSQIIQALEQGVTPDQIVEQLIQNGMSHEQAMQLVSQVTQQGQVMQQGGIVTQDPLLKELALKYGLTPEKAQELLMGGKYEKEYAQEGVRVASRFENPELYTKQSPTGNEWQSFGELLKNNPTEVLSNIKELHPELYSKFFKGDKIPSHGQIRKFQEAVNDKYSNIRKDYVKIYGEDSEKVKQLDASIEQDKFLQQELTSPEGTNTQVRAIDAFLGNYTSTRPNFTIEVLPKKNLEEVKKAGVNTASELKEKFPDLHKQYVEGKGLTSDFWLGDIKEPSEQINSTEVTTIPTEEIQRTRGILFQGQNPFILPPSGLQPVAKQEVRFGELDPSLVSIEPNIQTAESQRLANLQAYQENLSPEVAAAMQATALTQTQGATNQAISQAEMANAQARMQANQYNLGMQAKEDLTNVSLDRQYQDMVMKGLANQEADWRGYFNKLNEIQALNNLNANRAAYTMAATGYLPINGEVIRTDEDALLNYVNRYKKSQT